MKTTIDISSSIFEETKRYARKNNMTFKSVLESSLRHFFETQQRQEKQFRLKKSTFKGKGLVEGLTEGNWSEVRSLIYRGHGE